MSNIMRWRYGGTNPVTLPVDSATDIEIGDMVMLIGRRALPPSSIHNSDDFLSIAQQQFHDSFVGVAMQRSIVGDAGDIRIATSGVFEFDCDESIFHLGAFVGIAAVAGEIQDQRVIQLHDKSMGAYSIGCVAKQVSPADTKVLVEISSTLMRDGPQSTAPVPAQTNGTAKPGMYAISFDVSGDGLENLRIRILPEPLFRTAATAKEYADEMAGPRHYGVIPVDALPASVREELLVTM